MINNIPKTIAAMLLSFKMILFLNDNWETYQRSGVYVVREVEKREVDKMLSCMDPENVIKPFSWRKNLKEHTGKDPLKCRDCGGEMLLYKVVYRNKNGDLKEYGGLDMLLKKIMARSGKRTNTRGCS